MTTTATANPAARARRKRIVTAFNSMHHFDLGRFLAEVARALRAGGQRFVHTRTPEQNARTIWGRWFPGFAEREQRLHSEKTLRDAVRQTQGLRLVDTQTFSQSRSSTPERLRAQCVLAVSLEGEQLKVPSGPLNASESVWFVT